MKGLLTERLRELEQLAKYLGLEERFLIENASSNLFVKIDSLGLGRKVLVIAGRGNNGADTLSCARKLFSAGYKVEVAILSEKELGKEALWQKNILEKISITVCAIKVDNITKLKKLIQSCDFILEGILGIGVKGELGSFFKDVILSINGSGKIIVSCDIPSGLHPDQGTILGEAVKADYTITFLAEKRGFFLNQGPNCCGKVFVTDIGISLKALEMIDNSRIE